MAGAERIELAFRALREAVEPAALADRADAVATPGQDLVRISLMPDIPDQPIGRCVEHIVQRNGKLHHAQPGAQMSTDSGDRVDRFGAQFIGNLLKLTNRKFTQALRIRHLIKQWCRDCHVRL